MSRKGTKRSVRKADIERVLVTDTLPYETPIIFSNQGLYENLTSKQPGRILDDLLSQLVRSKTPPDYDGPSVPFKYKILKGQNSYRRLSVLHPLSQYLIRDFYSEYDRLILYYCRPSRSSIRAPSKVAGTYFEKSSWENISKYKQGTVQTTSLDPFTRHSPSYFAYKGYDRLYKFFDSDQFLDLESRFPIFKTLDVSKCFDSIYTHSMAWATKNRTFSKNNLNVSSTFGDKFDEIIRHGNSNETNGIPIGPEASRIFAEILFQRIDTTCVQFLRTEFELNLGAQYELLRYVDDVFIFAVDSETANHVYNVYADKLMEFNLHTNTEKSSQSTRPFVTSKSKLIQDATRCVHELVSKTLQSEQEGKKLVPQIQLRSKRVAARIAREFIEDVKQICSNNHCPYSEVSSFLIAVLLERLKKVINVEDGAIDDSIEERYYGFLYIYSKVVFFLYSVGASVSSSYKMATSIILVARFARKHFRVRNEDVYQEIYSNTEAVMRRLGPGSSKGVTGYVGLEAINVVLAARELGPGFLMPASILEELFLGDSDESSSYFHLVSCLFYIRNDNEYNDLKTKLVKVARRKLADLQDIKVNTERAVLLLDLTRCPYIDTTQRQKWLNRALNALGVLDPTHAQLDDYLQSPSNLYWFINWSEVDLLNSLEKRELKSAY